MPTYTFQALSDADFEELACDLLGTHLGIIFQTFTSGRDGGIDLLHGTRMNRGVVVQCKHYWRSGFAKLKAAIGNEVPKLVRLQPKRFILATSVGLTPGNKEDLFSLLKPHCRGLQDIYGREDINALLRAHEDVETKHYKLWLTSVAVLQRVLQNGRAVWNEIEKSEIERKMSLYVQTDAYGAALTVLGEHNYCIISGIPGIGKTTLAQILVTRLLEDGFELLSVREDIGEALELLDLTRRQVVYYDDFLGRSSIGERLGKNEDRGILRLLSEAKQSRLLKVIFTTREYILADAQRLYESLGGPEVDMAKCIVKLEDYTRSHRARILYNHVYFSGLSHAHAQSLVKNRAYKRIVDHSNYSPRIVEWMTSAAGVAGVPFTEFPAAFVAALDNPSHIWEHVFENQIGGDARAILLSLATIGKGMELDDCRQAWGALVRSGVSTPLTREERQRFLAALKQLDGSFLRSNRLVSQTVVQFHNPSIRDFVSRLLAGDAALRGELLNTAQYFEQVSCLIRLGADGHFAERPSGIMCDDNNLRAAIVRLLSIQSSHFDSTGSFRGSWGLVRRRASVGARLSELSDWAPIIGSEDFLDFVCAEATKIISKDGIAKVANVECCTFVEAVARRYPPCGGPWSDLVTSLVLQIGSQVIDGGSANDWFTWSRLVNENKDLLDASVRKKFADEAKRFCEEEIETIDGDSNGAGDATESLDTVEGIACYWGVELDFDRDEICQHAEERHEASRERSWDDWEGESRPNRAAATTGGTDAEIEQLFRSLEEKDWA